MKKIKKWLLVLKRLARNFYSFLICPQECIICKLPTESAILVCDKCIEEKFKTSLQEHFQYPERFCLQCGKLLISEQELCTRCREIKNSEETKNKADTTQIFYDQIFTIYPYKSKLGVTLIHWKNLNHRGFADFFSEIISEFLDSTSQLKNIAIVPVPPRPKKIKNKGWDQIEDLATQLEARFNIEIIRALKRDDGITQKSLGLKKRQTNLKGKIHIKNKKIKLPETLIILDDVMTTGSTLNYCAKELKANGCKKVYGLCLFYD